MIGIIANFRSSRHRQKDNHMIIHVDGLDSKEKAKQIVGKKVIFKTDSGKEILGKISSAHGNKGSVRVIFEKGMPGQSLTKKVEII